MAYILNQLNQVGFEDKSAEDADNTAYMVQLKDGVAARKKGATDSGVSSSTSDPFEDECIKFNTALNIESNYYLHAKIKRLQSEQTFYVYLINYNGTDNKTQFLKSITIQGGNTSEWVDFEVIFSPLSTFDCILFQLQRETIDYKNGERFPVIIYQELSEIKNKLNQIKQGVSLTKMGIQSHPGLMMCINGEEIHIGRSGIYEIRNNAIEVDFFSVVKAAKDDDSFLNNKLKTLSSKTASKTSIVSECIFDKNKTRSVDSFTLDYMYRED